LSEELRGQCKLSPIIKRPLIMKILRTVPNNHGMLVKTMWQSTMASQKICTTALPQFFSTSTYDMFAFALEKLLRLVERIFCLAS
ncbi:MAG: hypothetical protein L3J57_08110, partial [Desulfuromusa sp.]|nr:hypothetical protein [Desulfuromusa sp.]